ncbi:MAG TPA: hypothetical protein PKD09_18535 [Aggregatilinea sp.]|uniref:WD40 repeat domain-containing protein n=1 Tax=Aggregatilinea sp. TaxID=2806333 RepID=UPI002C51922F|nr:hypothetical protein [Aggregatilinea sp.]HML23660.1 hypothetical protein [Aggregatilinea sp.]
MERPWKWGASRWLAALLVGLMLVGVGLPAASAQQDEVTRGKAEQWLKRTLNKPNMTLVSFTYSGTSWPDSSMGCPAPEGTPIVEGVINGYEWFFLFDNMVRYEVHSNLDASQVVLCSAVSATSDVILSTYKAATYSLLVPEAWLSFPNEDETEVVFGPQQTLACDQPGMRLRVLGRVASGITPDEMINERLAELGATDDITARQTAGTYGRWTAYQTPCESVTQQHRLAAFVRYGSAYTIEQWASDADFAQWDQPFMDMLTQFKPGEGTLTPAQSSGDAALAEQMPALPMAHLFLGDVFLGALNDIPGRSITSVPTQDRRYLDFSPDGLTLSFVDVTAGQLRVLDAAQGVSPRKIAVNVDATFPPAWRADSQEIAYTVATGTTDATGAALFDLMAVAATGGEPRTLGQFAFGGGCPTGYSDPADRPYFEESGPQGMANTLVWISDQQFLISTRCDGGVGYLNLADGTIDARFADMHSGVLSPDRARFAGRGPQGLAIIDMASGARTDLSVGADASQLAWSPDGASLYYSTTRLTDGTLFDKAADEERGQQIFGFWPVQVGVYELGLARVDVASGEKTDLWRGEGRAIGRIAPIPDGSGVVFSVISSSVPVAEIFQAGADPTTQYEAWPGPLLYMLLNGQDSARLLAYSGAPVFASVTLNASSDQAAEGQ